MTLTYDTALQLAVMVVAGMPTRDAIRYFADPSWDPEQIDTLHQTWLHSPEFAKALLSLQGKAWQDMSLPEKMRWAVDKHYAEMAYFLYANNYNEVEGAAKNKADVCRQALEAKLAGTSGTVNAMTQFFEDFKLGKLTLGTPRSPAAVLATIRPS